MHKNLDRVKNQLKKRFGLFFSRTQMQKYSDGEKYFFSFCNKGKYRVYLYEGKVRTDYPEGFIAIDFNKTFNKYSDCPILCSINEPIMNVYNMVERLEKFGTDFSEHCGRFVFCPNCKEWHSEGDLHDNNPLHLIKTTITDVGENNRHYECKCLKCGHIFSDFEY